MWAAHPKITAKPLARKGPSNAETAYYHDLELDIDATSLDKEEGVEQFPDTLHHTENSTGHHCNWRLIRRKRTMTEYYGPCDNMRNMTESAIAMSEDRFIYHDFDKIRTRPYAILYWIIDTSNYKISNTTISLTVKGHTDIIDSRSSEL
nr:unnamed protein product [Spirometra erinaceieuropaei]